MKKIISLMIVAVLFVTCMIPAAFAADTSVVAQTKEIKVADAGTNVTLAVTSSAAITSFNFTFGYDSRLTLVGVSNGTANTSFVNYGTNVGGYAAPGESYPAGSVLCYIEFTVPADAKSGDFYEVTLSMGSNDGIYDVDRNEMGVSLGNGGIKIAHEHDYTYNTEVVDPTCTADGYTRHYCECGEYYDDTVVPATGHSYTSDIVEASCTVDGSITYTCSGCGHTYTETLTAPGHDYEVTSTSGVNCEEHGVDTYTCSVCGHTYTEDNDKYGDHKYIAVYDEATNNHTHNIVCEHCGDVYLENEACYDKDGNGKCDACGHDMPTTPPATGDDDDKDDVPKTGDITPYPVYFLIVAMAVMATSYGFKRKFVK